MDPQSWYSGIQEVEIPQFRETVACKEIGDVQVRIFQDQRFDTAGPDVFAVEGQWGNDGAKEGSIPAPEADRSHGIACGTTLECVS